jgi:hypothetical protein
MKKKKEEISLKMNKPPAAKLFKSFSKKKWKKNKFPD